MPPETSVEPLPLDEKIKRALRGLASKRWKTPYAAAKALGLSQETLKRRMKRIKSRTQAREVQQMLTKSEEKVLTKWITHLTATGHPARHEFIREMAEEIRARRGIQEENILSPLGVTWVQRFIKRNPDLKTVISRSIEAARIREVTPKVVADFFDALKGCIEDYQITTENMYNMDETGLICTYYQSLIVGVAIGTAQTSYVVVDSHLRKKYQTQPGRQEWVTSVECVCADGSSIAPLIIFKGKTLLNTWIPLDILNSWHYSCNTKGWTSNIHGEQWVENCFDIATKEKANGQYRLLICDGHDSHISAQFVRYCIDHKIIVFLLPPHSSHLLQPLDVGVFGPVKAAMGLRLSRLYAMEISRLQKIEWLENYRQARAMSIVEGNILGGWRGAGLFPLNPHRILRQISDTATPPPPTEPQTPTPYLISSSPPDVTSLHSANKAFNDALEDSGLPTPVKMHGKKLGGIAEHLHADNTLLRQANTEMKGVMGKRAERQSTKRIILRGKFIITDKGVHNQLKDAERITKQKKTKKGHGKQKPLVQEAEILEDDTSEDSGTETPEILDCVEVLPL